MGRAVGLFAASLLLSGSTTVLLETRRASPAARPGAADAVVADLDEEYRGDAEDAIARRLPGAVAASTLPVDDHAEAVWSSLFSGAADDTVFVWDTVVVVTVAQGVRRVLTPEGVAILDPDDGYERVDFRVSVFRTADRREIFGLTVRSRAGGAATDTFGHLAAHASSRAARELEKSRLFP